MNRILKIATVIIMSIIIFILIPDKKENNFIKDINNNKKENINILMLNSYQQGHYWEGFVLEGLKEELSQYDNYNINLKIEYLDFRSNNSDEYLQSFEELLEDKYSKGSIDLVYAVNDEAYNFMKEVNSNKESQFYEIPMVMTGVDQEFATVSKHESSDAVGFYHVDDTLNLLHLILDLNKEVDKLNLIMENSFYCKSVTNEILSYIDNISQLAERKIEIEFVTGDYIEDITDKLKNLDPNYNAVNIVAGEFQYKNSNIFLDPKDTINTIKKYNSYQTYSNDQTYLNAGIVGGCVDIGQEHGKVAADLIIKIISGMDMSMYNIEAEPEAKIYLDYNGIYEYGINPTDIDSSMNVINRKFYQFVLPKSVKLMLGCIILSMIIFMIVTILGELEIKKLNKKAKEEEIIREYRDNLKSDFIVNLSHELRTPINLILNTSKTIRYKLNKFSLKHMNDMNEIKEDIENKLEVVDNNSYRLLKISNNIIDITKAESGLLKLDFKNQNIVSIVEEAFSNSIAFAQKKNINMIFDSDLEEIIMAVDSTQIQRVVLNLISNSIKYTEKNGRICVNINKIKNEVLIKVSDNGIGIAKDKLDEIFQRFYQVNYSLSRLNEGTGVGLCVVKDIVNIHGGRIEVESEENKGSIFKIYLPINIEDEVTEEKVININYDIRTMANIELSDLI